MARSHPIAILIVAGLVAGGAANVVPASAQPADTSPFTHTPSAPSSPSGTSRPDVPPSEKLPTWPNQKREQVSPTPAPPGTQRQPLSAEQAKRRARHPIPGTNTVPGTTAQPRTTMPPQQ
ncbi:hypothetical protein AA13595_0028 [Gluconacetobacter johannae DSM 13595]|uniref:Uncharacterized protein n=1 Tax=Gluconacetobacter johannae TaxID=112140 RepID=A0A7W4J5G8_9PROT|nr:hypothetical protein [Gluconacetobacter johannae]MBB2174818.1 hypothetical protein [Gluconacetobacter johannae]GBQ79449.1 hypothetical protein AA13595_0028 [Gluconacetobacter johannae DSM 13595]